MPSPARPESPVPVPRVSVIVPNYNHAAYLRQRMQSVLNQTFRDLEVIVLDDASTDASLEVLREFEADPRVQIHPGTVNSGSTFRQWNKGARLARGEYLWIAESDDYADERFLERLVGMLDHHPRCGMACCESWYVLDEQPPTTRTNESHVPENARWRENYVADGRTECAEHLVTWNTMPNASAVVLRRAVYEQVGGANESMRLCGDWLLWVRVLSISDLAHVGEPLNYYRCHTAAVRKQNHASATTTAEVYRIIAYIDNEIGVAPEKLEQVLESRARRFIEATSRRKFSVADVWKVYRAAGDIDRRAAERILLGWCRRRAAGALRRLRAMVRRPVSSHKF